MKITESFHDELCRLAAVI
ncbi:MULTISPECIES: protein YrbN [Tatumella]|uniref:Protein YrbN n=2 Tax=Tatumella TaxID=82986 RepID=A0ABW1VJG3_9GAMM|nr:protein YrbN [Tatumella sp. JGM16]MBS0877389.1 protein YrbN [Tatumella sp. JGM82]MBS0890738.1 protein YrbN [Tatumella sp. JGM94]MBS0893476.1 protein YrbN [Tatumella sp. JGM130]MBS0901786.1 protein YrbN [Tatumella sp. JGM100]MBS0910516.1 protein YrbN [Tatumella sp. JGM118]MBS0912543.1 protein YrbN [Tatumella sp. JGM91]